MKTLTLAFLTTALLNLAPTFAGEHGGGNGGDDLEMELKKRSLQIGYFIKSDVGSKVFKMLNGDSVIETINSMDIDVTTENVVDKYNTLRTCVNEPERSLITCNLKRLTDLRSNKKEDILTGMLFHEILGLMGLELGYQDNVSMYPTSSKIIPYNDIVIQTPVTEGQIRPEFYGLDSRSYGITIVNKETQESIRMICLNNNVEVHRCRNYTVVRKANGMQVPLVSDVISLSPRELAQVHVSEIQPHVITERIEALKKLEANGYKYLSTDFGIKGQEYTFGAGLVIATFGNRDDDCYYCYGALLGLAEIDLVAEASKQAVNLGVWPVKAAVNALRVAGKKSQINRLNKKMGIVREVLNLDTDLSLVGKTKIVSDEDYRFLAEVLKAAVLKAKSQK